MGMGTRGPPIPPAATFSVVPYPIHRKSPPGSEFSHYIFVTNDPHDPNLIAEEQQQANTTSNNHKDQMSIEEAMANNDSGEKSPDNANTKSQNSNKQKTPKTGTSRNESRGDAATNLAGKNSFHFLNNDLPI